MLSPLTSRSAGTVLECSIVPWDTEIFGFPVAQISRLTIDERGDPAVVLDAFEAWCAAQGVRLISCRLDHTQLRESMVLEATGFRFIEMVYGPRFDAFGQIGASRHDVALSVATEVDVPADRGHRVLGVLHRAVPARWSTRAGAEPPTVRDMGADEFRV